MAWPSPPCARSPCCSCAAKAASATTRRNRSRLATSTSRPTSCSTSCAIFPEPAMSDPRPLWLRDPLAVLAEGDAAGGIVVAGNRITELVPAGREPAPPGGGPFEGPAHVGLPGPVNTPHHFYHKLTPGL